MKLLIKYPSAFRPRLFLSTFQKYYGNLSGIHDVRFIVSCDNNDHSMKAMGGYLARSGVRNVVVKYHNNTSKIEAINSGMESEDFDVLLLASDDMIPMVSGYDDIICTDMQKYFPDLDGCLHYNDGRSPQLNSLSIMGKKLYDHFGYIYHQDYKSLWSDNEYQEVTEGLGKSKFIDRVIISHEWTNVTGQDSLHVKNEKYFKQDKQTFELRKKLGFPKESVLKGTR